MQDKGETQDELSADNWPVLRTSNQDTEARIVRLEAVAAAVERWLADPRYVTEQLMMKALRELRELDRRS